MKPQRLTRYGAPVFFLAVALVFGALIAVGGYLGGPLGRTVVALGAVSPLVGMLVFFGSAPRTFRQLSTRQRMKMASARKQGLILTAVAISLYVPSAIADSVPGIAMSVVLALGGLGTWAANRVRSVEAPQRRRGSE